MVKYIKYKKGLFILGLFIATLTVISESVFALVMKETIDNISLGSETLVLKRLPIYLVYIFIMISLSFINTLYVQFIAKKDLVDHYMEMLNAKCIDRHTLYIDSYGAIELINKYFKEGE